MPPHASAGLPSLSHGCESPNVMNVFFENENNNVDRRWRCAVLGCGMMGQEHVSYMAGYADHVRIDYLCDPHTPSLEKCLKVLADFYDQSSSSGSSNNNNSGNTSPTTNAATTATTTHAPPPLPRLLSSEAELLQYAEHIDLLVIATPNYMHTDTLLRWSRYNVTILVEKPVAISWQQVQALQQCFFEHHDESAVVDAENDQEDADPTAWRPLALSASAPRARIWVAMEYRFIPAIAKLLELIPTVLGDKDNGGGVTMCTIRENRFPFLHKVGAWNRNKDHTGDSLVEKCCHFFDLMRLITKQEPDLQRVRTMAQRGINYQDEELTLDPIIDSAYVFMPFRRNDDQASNNNPIKQRSANTMACLELCMYADGSRHQEEVIVTGPKGRLEAYLPENKVYAFVRPDHEAWRDRSVPPPQASVQPVIYDCSNVKAVHGIDAQDDIPTHGGYHYGSTAIEWYRLLRAMEVHHQTGVWKPAVSLQDGIRAVEMGLAATQEIVNEQQQQQHLNTINNQQHMRNLHTNNHHLLNHNHMIHNNNLVSKSTTLESIQ